MYAFSEEKAGTDAGQLCGRPDTGVTATTDLTAVCRDVQSITVVWHLTKKLNADWDLGEDHYNIVIHGEPEVRTRIRFVPPESWGNA